MTPSLRSSAGTLIGCAARTLLGSCLSLLVLQGSVLGQEDWVLPERSQANLDALARVEIRTYEMPQADGAEVEFGPLAAGAVHILSHPEGR